MPCISAGERRGSARTIAGALFVFSQKVVWERAAEKRFFLT
jgi:hypothetical protein